MSSETTHTNPLAAMADSNSTNAEEIEDIEFSSAIHPPTPLMQKQAQQQQSNTRSFGAAQDRADCGLSVGSSLNTSRTLSIDVEQDERDEIAAEICSPNLVRHTSKKVPPAQLALLSDVAHQHALEQLFSKSAYNGFGWIEVEDVVCKDDKKDDDEAHIRRAASELSHRASPVEEKQQQQEQPPDKKKEELGPRPAEVSAFPQPLSSSSPLRTLTNYPAISYRFDDGGLHLLVGDSLFRVQLLSILVRVVGLILLWLLLWTLLKADQPIMERGGVIFDPALCFVMCSIIGKLLGKLLGVPPLIVIFVAGLMWGSVPTFEYLTGGITPAVRLVIGRLGLANILLRTGLAVTPKTLAPAKFNILAMSVLPMLAEILVHGFMAGALFDYGNESLWPFLQAMVAAPSASGVVAAVVMIIQQKGYTKARGPGMLLIPACALDMTLGVWGVNFVASLISRDPNDSLAWPILQGPVQIIVGGIAGVALGWIWYGSLLVFFTEAKPLPHGKLAGAFVESVSLNASVLLGAFACLTIFVGYYIESAGGGCIACTLLGATVQYLTTRDGKPESSIGALFGIGGGDDDDKKKVGGKEEPPYTSPEEHRYVRQRLVVNFALTWDSTIMPALFCFSGSALDVRAMFNPDTVGIALGTIFSAFAVRSIVCGLCSWSYPLTTSEWVITSVALGGKAFSQVALGGVGKTVTADLLKRSPNMTVADAQRLNDYAGHVANTGALSVLFVSPIVVVLLSVVGPKMWMTDKEFFAAEQEEAGREQKKQEEEEMASSAPTSVVPVAAAVTEAKQPVVVDKEESAFSQRLDLEEEGKSDFAN